MRLIAQKKGSILVAALTFFFCWLFCLREGVFGAKVDWLSQHSVFADYFRRQFYETGQLFPEFAANIGGGQNIYHFAYYGLYSPVILLSYLLPFVKMADYLMAAQLLGLTAAVLLMYVWLKKRGFEEMICVGCSLLFLLAGPMIFHSYSQIMFVNYMPFLVLALIGVDRYFQTDGRLLAVSVFLMIMTSFYFSIGGMLVLVLYGMYRYFQIKDESGDRVTFVRFLGDGLRFLLPMLAAVLMSGVLLAPTAAALAGQDRSGQAALSLGELLIPKLGLNRLFYSPYGTGLTTFALVVLLAGLTYRKRAERVLYMGVLGVLVIPAFAWILNGGLYIRDKVMIPFLPLLCYMTADYLRRQKERAVAAGVIPYLLAACLIFAGGQGAHSAAGWKLLMADSLIMLLGFCVFLRWRKPLLLIAPAVLFLVVFDSTYHAQADRMLERGFYEEVTDEKIGEVVSGIEEQETGFYRTEQLGTDRENEADLNRVWDMGQYISSVYSSSYNEEYRNFRKEVFLLEEPFRNFLMQSASKNPVFQRFMGVKYVLSKEPVAGYELYRSCGNVNVYKNDEALPIAYATDRTMDLREYEELEFPYNQLALLNYVVVDERADGERGAKGERSADAEGASDGERSAEVEGTADGEETAEVKETAEGERSTDAEGAANAEGALDAEGTAEDSVRQTSLSIGEEPDAEGGLEQTADGFRIQTKRSISTQAALPEKAGENEVLFLRFAVKNNKASSDVAVWVNGVRNKLSAKGHIYYNENDRFIYAIPLEEGQEVLELTFGSGDYEISDVECFVGRIGGTKEKLCQSEFLPDRERTKGNRIAGSINVREDGYFVTTIPYDSGFEVRIDGKNITYTKVNTAFLGFPIDEGEHTVELIYHAPGAKTGKIMSAAGILLLLCCCLRGRRSHMTRRQRRSFQRFFSGTEQTILRTSPQQRHLRG